MNHLKITSLQKSHGYLEIQEQINNGSIWKMEGSQGRYAMDLLNLGYCMLPKKSTFDYYGNELPSRDTLKKGTKGTYQNCARFWERVVANGLEDYI